MDSGSSVPESGEYSNDIQNKMVTLNDVDGHEENNLCSNCKKELSPDHIKERDVSFSVITHFQSNLYCEDCYNSLFNKNCSVCGEPITDESYVDEMGNYYHKVLLEDILNGRNIPLASAVSNSFLVMIS